MKKNPTVSLALRTDKEKKDGTCPFYLLVNFKGKVYKFPTTYKAKPSEWNQKSKSVKNNVRLMQNLNNLKTNFENWVLDCNRSNIAITIDAIKRHFAQNDETDLFEFYERQIKERSATLVPNTIKGYKSNLHVLQNFRDGIKISDVDLSFIKEFDNYLRVKRENSSAGRFSHHKNLRSMLYLAIAENKIAENPYKNFPLPKVPPKKIWLTEVELKEVEEYIVPANKPGMQRAKDIFLFASYTGLRYSDVVDLKPEHIKNVKGKYFVVKVVVKTKQKIVAPLPPKALALLKTGIENGEFFFRVSNSTLNYHLVELGKLLKFDKRITSHVGRRSFGFIAVNKDKNIFAVSAALGHKDVRMTQKYYVEADYDSIYSVVES